MCFLIYLLVEAQSVIIIDNFDGYFPSSKLVVLCFFFLLQLTQVQNNKKQHALEIRISSD